MKKREEKKMKLNILKLHIQKYQKETHLTTRELAKELDLTLTQLFKIFRVDLNLTPGDEKKIVQCGKYMAAVNGFEQEYPTYQMSYKMLLEQDPKQVSEVIKQERKYITKHQDFKLLGVSVKDFEFNPEARLYFIKPGYCRITEHQLFRAMRDKNFADRLVKSAKFGYLTNYDVEV